MGASVFTLRRAALALLALGCSSGGAGDGADPVVLAGDAGAACDPAALPAGRYLDNLAATAAGPLGLGDTASAALCPGGEAACVDGVVAAMTTRLRPLADACSHDAVFALTYLRTTERYRRAVEDPAYFRDNAWVNREDAVFARYYFDAHDAWTAGDRCRVPAAWQVAFSHAERRALTAAGNIALGISAHVRRDLPFVLYHMGVAGPDGERRRPDHDRVNDVLAGVFPPLAVEVRARFDPSFAVPDALAAVVFQWRAEAWENATRLSLAATAEERLRVARSIEQAAAEGAVVLARLFALPANGSSAARDAFCAARP